MTKPFDDGKHPRGDDPANSGRFARKEHAPGDADLGPIDSSTDRPETPQPKTMNPVEAARATVETADVEFLRGEIIDACQYFGKSEDTRMVMEQAMAGYDYHPNLPDARGDFPGIERDQNEPKPTFLRRKIWEALGYCDDSRDGAQILDAATSDEMYDPDDETTSPRTYSADYLAARAIIAAQPS